MASLAKLLKIQSLLNDLINDMQPETKTKEKPEKTEKNLPRMTPTISKKLEEVVKEVTEWDDKIKKEFAEYVNSMEKDSFSAKKLEEHIDDFAFTKRSPASQGGGGAEAAPAKETVTTLTYKELKELKALKETDDPLVFRTKKGLVTGPDEVSDEDMEDGLFEGAEILIGEKTRRVYNSEEEFMGWWGIGKFKEADM